MLVSLETIIKDVIIQNQAPIGFDEFMDLALYQPQYGYYRAGLPKFGETGDFITAPETSDLFGFCLARQCQEVLNEQDSILEFGAGSGVLAAQILFELGRLEALPHKYYILELSGELRQRQRQTIEQVLPELIERVEWLDELPTDFQGVIIANEVLDAIPAKRLRYQTDGFVELGVDYQDGVLVEQVIDGPISHPGLPKTVIDGYTTEINPRALAWVGSLGALTKQALVLLIDYGMGRQEFFHEQRAEGTLRCYYRHQASDNPFVNIGKQDITTSVNFSDVAERAGASGFEVLGYATQAMFLISLGIEQYLLSETDTDRRAALAQQIKHLVLPSAMGESFKVLALGKGIEQTLSGFKEQDLAHTL